MKPKIFLSLTVIFGFTSSFALATVTQGEADHLGKDLTPVGAERTGNKDGTIPAWDGKDSPLPGWNWGKNRKNFSKYKDEKPLFTIDQSTRRRSCVRRNFDYS